MILPIACLPIHVAGFNLSKLVLLKTLAFMYSNASNSQLLQYQGPILYVCGAHPIKRIVA